MTGMPKPTHPMEPHSGDRDKQIIQAAHDLLEQSGLEGLTIRSVLARTGLARRAFYDRFAGKDDLVLAVFEQSLEQAAAGFAERVAALRDPMARLQHIVTGIVLGRGISASEQFGRRGAALSREHLRLAESRPADLQRAIAPLVALIAKQLSDGLASGQVRDAPVNHMAMLVYNLVATTMHSELLAEESGQPDQLRRAQLASEIWEFCRRAVAA